jgi:hypothetical protein
MRLVDLQSAQNLDDYLGGVDNEGATNVRSIRLVFQTK